MLTRTISKQQSNHKFKSNHKFTPNNIKQTILTLKQRHDLAPPRVVPLHRPRVALEEPRGLGGLGLVPVDVGVDDA